MPQTQKNLSYKGGFAAHIWTGDYLEPTLPTHLLVADVKGEGADVIFSGLFSIDHYEKVYTVLTKEQSLGMKFTPS